MSTLLEARDLTFAYHDRLVLRQVSLTLQTSELVGLIGPNGSGKSTLLRVLLGFLLANRGEVTINGTPIHTLGRKERAKRLAFVPQETALEIGLTVQEVVAMGRTPYLGRFRPETTADLDAIAHALRVTQTEHLAQRPLYALSGGERQRVMIARAVAQQTPALFLDEPTANLDLTHQLGMLELVRSVVQAGRGAIAALHDLSLAARFCDRLILLAEGTVVATGTPQQVMTEERLLTYFHIQARVRQDAEVGHLLVVPLASVHPPGPNVCTTTLGR